MTSTIFLATIIALCIWAMNQKSNRHEVLVKEGEKVISSFFLNN
jgi:hypothetical protein